MLLELTHFVTDPLANLADKGQYVRCIVSLAPVDPYRLL